MKKTFVILALAFTLLATTSIFDSSTTDYSQVQPLVNKIYPGA